MLKYLIVLFPLFFTLNFSVAQSPVFSQYYTTSLYLNPALVGSESDITIGMNYRAQWNQLESPYQTAQITYMHPLIKPGGRSKHVGGIGVSILSDQAGNNSLSNTGINFSGAFNYHLSSYGNNILTFGLQAGVYRNALNIENLQWGSQYNAFSGFDPTIEVDPGNLQDQRFYAVINAGMMWYYRQQQRYSTKSWSSYAGISVYHLNQPNTSLINDQDNLPLSLRFHGGISFPISAQAKLTPSALAVYELSDIQLNAGGYLTYSLGSASNASNAAVILGAWYRLSDSFIVHVGTEIKNFRLAFSYDHNVSSFQRYFGTSGSYEFSIQYRIIRKHQSVYFSTPLI
ncbi:PorP/SprF family type IX secretion system membrane protein [Fulvivirga sedimenti]|uniref:PorP/SprF family type IX secretion system membrane protein n=1 Tax=Fulvivirga sedimenti TaxID=2879465 RepID=A0A9X1HQ83_9BACT|nr:PorP/SprF family type IX secretion system membrane protein [Fulvivirga sedimenti]MCA6074789.1 PorP/SprF family type IX secretion system membrane protein [Fulvivirga sedimenti]MCA6075966.1 PorP/SprF family type IX secretion system membrane protein [Fulvivirga sedimenti]MCA6077094.1 PorP/SprF family type IX secretion system membrane protein [Fulvivirga sedimenti]